MHDPIGGAHGVLGLQWRDDEFSAIGEEAYVPETESTEIGLFLVEDFHRGDWTWEVGIRGDWVERDPDTPAAGSEDFITGYDSWDDDGSFYIGSFSMYDGENTYLIGINPEQIRASPPD